MSIGALRHRIQIHNATRTGNSRGGESLTWASAGTVYAKVTPLSGSEQLRGMQLDAKVSHRIRIRHRDDITIDARSRIVWGSRTFNVRSVIDVEERGRWLDILAEEGVAE